MATGTKVGEKIKSEAQRVKTTILDGKTPSMKFPLRSLSNVKYSPRKRILEMGKNKNRRQLFNLSQAKSYMQTVLVASGCKQLI
ncbi:MAG: DNA topoisomerase VI, partial [Candidatus Krumholzibacteriota bacterium]|nr:DNA topoisomerase VI [Candidatus Krumholzibacteriota bacterium]